MCVGLYSWYGNVNDPKRMCVTLRNNSTENRDWAWIGYQLTVVKPQILNTTTRYPLPSLLMIYSVRTTILEFHTMYDVL
jgi:hypothetical protein